MARPIALVAAVLAVVALIWLSWDRIAPPDPAPPSAANESEDPGSVEAVELARDSRQPATTSEAVAGKRDAVEPIVGATTGSLLLTAVWADDKSPARNIPVAVYRSGADELFEQPRGTTDELGQYLFDGLAPGRVFPICSGGRDKFGERLEIVAGQRIESTIEVPVGLAIRGRVVDGNGAAVANAEIAVADWGGGSVDIVGKSGEDGTFALRGLPNNCHVGARKAGYCPTSMRTLTTSGGAEVEFTIVMDKIGGSLRGTVLGPGGQPAAGTVVRVGSLEQNHHKLPDGGSAMAWQPQLVRSDERGHFELASVVPGKIPVQVRGLGLAPWSEDIEIAEGRPTEITVHLQRGSTLFGVAKNDAGEPLAKVRIRVGEWRDLGQRSALTAADGSYRLEGLGLGTFRATASHEDHGQIHESINLVAGEQRQWDPVLSAGLQVRGRVLDSEGKPVQHAMVEAMLDPWTPGTKWFGMENTDDDGRFTLKNCLADRTIKISVRRRSTFPEATLSKVMPGPEELEIRLPAESWVHIEGTVLGPNDEVLANVNASPFMIGSNSGSPVETPDPATGKFRFGPYPAGEYRITFSSGGYPSIRLEHTFAPNQTWDVGTLRFERGGSLKVVLLPDSPAADPGKRSLQVYRDGKRADQADVENGVGHCGPLAPGDYELLVTGGAIASEAVPFTIRADLETAIDVPVTVGVAASIVFELPPNEQPSGWVKLIVRDAADRIVHRRSVWQSEGTYRDTLALRPGTFTLDATWQSYRAEGTLEVATEPVSKTLQLR